MFINGEGSIIEVCTFYQKDMQHHDVLLGFDNLQRLSPINIDCDKKGSYTDERLLVSNPTPIQKCHPI